MDETRYFICVLLIVCAACHSYDEASSKKLEDRSRPTLTALLVSQAQSLGSVLADVKTLISLQLQHNQNLKTALEHQAQHNLDIMAKMEHLVDNQVQQPADEVMGGCDEGKTGLTTLTVQQSPMTVPCDGHGWIIMMRRVDNKFGFSNSTWEQYKSGFGNPTNYSFWLGLERLHRLTSHKAAKLRVELHTWDDEMRWAEYSYFRILDEEDGYRLMVSGYTGNAGDSFTVHSGMRFTTVDKDNDFGKNNCASVWKGAWWFNKCYDSFLTGPYVEDGTNVEEWRGIIWNAWKGKNYSYKKVEMKLFLQ